MTKEEAINVIIKDGGIDTNKISDGYHTFEELYDHRIILFICLCVYLFRDGHYVWRSKTHSDGSIWSGWFIAGVHTELGKQITYHIPIKYWETMSFANTLDLAPEFDGHSSADVLDRLKSLK